MAIKQRETTIKMGTTFKSIFSYHHTFQMTKTIPCFCKTNKSAKEEKLENKLKGREETILKKLEAKLQSASELVS